MECQWMLCKFRHQAGVASFPSGWASLVIAHLVSSLYFHLLGKLSGLPNHICFTFYKMDQFWVVKEKFFLSYLASCAAVPLLLFVFDDKRRGRQRKNQIFQYQAWDTFVIFLVGFLLLQESVCVGWIPIWCVWGHCNTGRPAFISSTSK